MTSQIKCPKKILVLANAKLEKACVLSDQVSEFLQNAGVCPDQNNLDFETPKISMTIEGYDLVIVIGGDGSILRAGHLCAPFDIPLLGINAGRFGFLVELTQENWQSKMPLVLAGDYRLERRMMLKAHFLKAGRQQLHQWDVINELVVSRGQFVRPIEIHVEIDSSYLSSYIADGLIASTATGSTAYALAAGGPILPPELRNILLMPIAPHLSLDRAVILSEGASISIQVRTDHEAIVSVDGLDPVKMVDEDLVTLSGNEKSLIMVRFKDPNYFYNNLMAYMENNPVTKIKK